MKRVILIATLLMPAASAMAISHYDVRTMTCAVTQGHVQKERAVILGYPYPGTNKMIYDRFVSSDSECSGFGNPVGSFVSTEDDPMCPVTICSSRDSG